MKKLKSTHLLIIVLTYFLSANLALANLDTNSTNPPKREHFDTFNSFYQSLPLLSMPIDIKNMPSGKYIDSQFFNFDGDDYRYYDNPEDKTNRYFTLKDLKAIGRFEIDDIKFVVFHFNFDSEGEGFVDDISLINAFDKNGQYLDELILSGTMGHEDHIFSYFASIDQALFHVQLDAHYELGYIREVKDDNYHYTKSTNLTYQFHDKQFWLQENPINCQTKNLKNYLNKIEQQQFADIADVAIFNDYINCFPVSENLITYKKIAQYLQQSHNHFLSNAEFKKFKERIKIITED